jgi:hypothetical protein
MAEGYTWEFRARFRRHSFGWRSQPAMKRIKEAMSEIKKVARKDKRLAAEGAVLFLERVSPALEQVDSSSGSIGNAVYAAIVVCVQVITSAEADHATRDAWLQRLFDARAKDRIPYIEGLDEYWGDLCWTPELASLWADRLMHPTRYGQGHATAPGDHIHGTSASLSELLAAGRFDELISGLEEGSYWPQQRWAVKALASQGMADEAIRYAEGCRSTWRSSETLDRVCEKILLAAGRADEAYGRYGLSSNEAGTYLAWFRAVAKKYPDKEPSEILADLIRHTPEEEGKWFAAAKSAKLFDEAIQLVNSSPCAPQTLARAARDFAESNPVFALEAGIASFKWLIAGHGYEITGQDVREAWQHTMSAAKNTGQEAQARQRIHTLVATETPGALFVTKVLAMELDR